MNDLPPLSSDIKTRLPRGLGHVVAVLSGLVAASALAGAIASVLTAPPTWFLLGFELVTLAAAVVGVLIGRGWYPSGPGLALGCVAGAIGASALFGYLGAAREIMGVDLKPFLIARLLAALALVALGSVAVVCRRPAASLPKLAAGSACAMVLVGMAFGAWKGAAAISGLAAPVQAIIGFVGFAVMLGLLAAAVHLIVAAFESCDIDQLEGAGDSRQAS